MKKFRIVAVVLAIALLSAVMVACNPAKKLQESKDSATAELTAFYDDLMLRYTYTSEDRVKIESAYSTALADIAAAEKKKDVSSILDKAKTDIGAITGTSGYTYRTYLAVSPSNWSSHTYQDNNDTAILSYVNSSFYEFDYARDADGNIDQSGFEVKNSAAAAEPEDVTAQYVGDKWGIKEGAEGRAWKITLRQDLKWDDGTPIKAQDFVYSMQELLNPLFKNHRADSYYSGAVMIHNAKSYVYQGSEDLMTPSDIMSIYGYADVDALLAAVGSKTAYVNWNYSFGEIYNGTEWLSEGFEDEVVETSFTLSEMKDIFVSKAAEWGVPEATMLSYFLDEASVMGVYPKVENEDLGILATGDYELVLILDAPLESMFDFAYNLGSSWLVKKDLYESCKVAPQSGSTLWTSTYATSLDKTASWGPYKLTYFQIDKAFTLEKNSNWFGYNMTEYAGQYQTTRIETSIVKEWNSAWLMFQKGQLSGIGIDPTIASDYKGSEQAYFTPDDYVGSLQLQSSATALKENEQKAGNNVDKEMLLYEDFRKALSLAINREDYARQVTTSSLAGFGLFNSMHYYDVANGKAYRDSDIAKEVLCEVYGVEYGADKTYKTLDEAYDAITGFDLTQARALLTSAYEAAIAAGTIDGDDKVVLTYGTSVDSESTRRPYNYLKKAFETLAVGTPLEGRLTLEFDGTLGDNWATTFRAGGYEICAGGWSGAAWDPFYFMLAYLGGSYRYAQAWDPSAVEVEITVPGAGENGADLTDTLDLLDWYYSLNGYEGGTYDFSILSNESRLVILGELEKAVLKTYYVVPITYYFAASLRSFQIKFPTEDYNTFMAWGSIRYYSYNYTDAQWADFVKSQGGTVDYK